MACCSVAVIQSWYVILTATSDTQGIATALKAHVSLPRDAVQEEDRSGTKYVVTWGMNVDADDPEVAAGHALACITTWTLGT